MPKKVVKKIVKKNNMKGGDNAKESSATPSWKNTFKSMGSTLFSGMKTATTSASQGLRTVYNTTKKAATSAALATEKSAHNALSYSRSHSVKKNNVEFNSVNILKNNKLNGTNNENSVKRGLKVYVSKIGTTLNDSKKIYSEIDTLLKKYATQETTFKYDLSQIKNLVKKIKSLTNTRYIEDYKTEVIQIVLKLKNDFKEMLTTLRTIYGEFTKLINSIYGTEQSSNELLKQLKNARTYIKQLLVNKTTDGKALFDSFKITKNSGTLNYNKIASVNKELNNLTKLNNSTGNSSSGSFFSGLIPYSKKYVSTVVPVKNNKNQIPSLVRPNNNSQKFIEKLNNNERNVGKIKPITANVNHVSNGQTPSLVRTNNNS